MFRRNTYLWSVVVVGAIVTAVGGTGIFAVFTDRATQGPNTFVSGPQASAADLQISSWDPLLQCSNWQEDLATPLWDATNMQPGTTTTRQLCLKNNGSAPLTVTFTTQDLTQSDIECTGDEIVVDPSCALPGQFGELAGLLNVDYTVDADCDTIIETGEVTGSGGPLSLLGATNTSLTTATGLPAGLWMCVSISVVYPSTTSLENVQAAQSDSVTWKFAFDGTAI